jgi:hypothetical protein
MNWSTKAWDELLLLAAGHVSPEGEAIVATPAGQRAYALLAHLPEAMRLGPVRSEVDLTDRLRAIFPKRPPFLAALRTNAGSFATARSGAAPMHAVYEAPGAQIQLMISPTDVGGWVASGRIEPSQDAIVFTEQAEPVTVAADGRFYLDLGQGASAIFVQTPAGRIQIPAWEEAVGG